MVEIDYQNKIIVIHKNLISIPSGYLKVETAMINGIPYIKCKITTSKEKHTGWFEYDTGAARSLYLSQEYVKKNKVDYKNLELINNYESSGSKGVNFERDIYRLPQLEFGEFETYRIPVAIAKKDPEHVDYNDILGNDLLKRFNAIIDFKNYIIYLKPNNLLHSPYKS